METPTDQIEVRTAAPLQQMSAVLHDLCQPLTTVQCRLEMAQLLDTCEDYREAVQTSAAECARLAAHVHALRDLLRLVLAAVKGED